MRKKKENIFRNEYRILFKYRSDWKKQIFQRAALIFSITGTFHPIHFSNPILPATNANPI